MEGKRKRGWDDSTLKKKVERTNASRPTRKRE
jgi:hypothetical protein